MATISWLSGVSNAWNTPAAWSGGVVPSGTLDDVGIAAPGSYTVSLGAADSVTVNSLVLNAPGAILSVGGTLALRGALGVLTLQSGVLKGAGTLQGGVLKLAGGTLAMGGGTLDGMTVLGTLAPSRFSPLAVVNGLTVKNAAGNGHGTIDLTGGALSVLDSETLDNMAINLGGTYGVLQLGAADAVAPVTLTLGTQASLATSGGAIAGAAGSTLVNRGSMAVSLDLSGAGLTIDPSLTNAGSMTIAAGSGNVATVNGLAFTNAGQITLGNNATLNITNAAGIFANSGSITLGAGALLAIAQNLTLAGLGQVSNSAGKLVLSGTLDLAGGTLDTASGAFARTTISGTVRSGTIYGHGGALALPGVTLDGITLRGTLDISQPLNATTGYTVTIANGLGADTQGGIVPVLLNAAGDQLSFTGSTTLDNLSVIIGGGTGFRVPASGIAVQGAGTLTLGTHAVLSATGTAFLTAGGLVNRGAIQLGAASSLTIKAGSFSNTGSISIGSAATLEIDIFATLPQFLSAAGTITNSGGLLTLGGTLDLAGGTLDVGATGLFSNLRLAGTVRGGTIRADGGTLWMGVQSFLGGQTVVTGPTLDGVTFAGRLDLSDSASGVSVVNGLRVLAGPGGGVGTIDLSAGQLTILDSETLDNVSIRLGAAVAPASPVSSSIWDGNAGRTLTLGGNARVTMAGNATISVGTLVNAGSIDAGAQSLQINAQSARNTGQIVLDGGTLEMSGSVLSENEGTLISSGAAALNPSGAAFSNSGLLFVAGGTLAVGTGLSNFSGATLDGGTYEVAAGATLTLGRAGALVTDNASITLDGPGAQMSVFSTDIMDYVPIEATLTAIGASGTLSVLGGRDYLTAGALDDSGMLEMGGGTLTAGALSVSASGVLGGYGTIATAIANGGLIEAFGGTLTLAAISGTGSLQVDPGATLELTAATSQDVAFAFSGGTLVLDAPESFTGHLSDFGPGDTLVLKGRSVSAATVDGNTLHVTLAAGGVLSYGLLATPGHGAVLVTNEASGNAELGLDVQPSSGGVPCFLTGTRLWTTRGEMAVEALRPGDMMETVLGRGPARVRWVGHRQVDCARHPVPADVLPVCIRAGAFGPGQPVRDLFLSPDHAVFAEGALIPVRYLVNGASIAQVAAKRVTYFHVELEPREAGESGHDVLLAEGLPAESFLDTGNRGNFANGGGAISMHPDFALRVWQRQSCAPLLVQGGLVQQVQSMLLTRAGQIGHARTAEPGLCVIAGSRVIGAEVAGEWLRFALPEDAGRVCLRSRVMVPAHMYPGGADHRHLGVAVAALRLDGCEVPARSDEGWHAAEAGWQWTDGAAMLDCAGARLLEVRLVWLGEYWEDEDAAGPVPAAHVRAA
jgi:hypothetical protein